MRRHVTSLPISVRERTNLQQRNTNYCEDVSDGTLSSSTTAPIVITGECLLEREQFSRGLPVFHAGLDKLLGGAIPCGRICLLSGAPGVGKTQLCLQLCCDTLIPLALGGAEGEALLVCTDGSFTIERLRQIAAGSVKLFPGLLSIDSMLQNIHVARIFGIESLNSTLLSLPDFLLQHTRLRLLVIDSFSLPFMCEEPDTFRRTQLVHQAVTRLLTFATSHNLVVVLTIQLTTLLMGQTAKIIPCLGEGLRHRVALHIYLEEHRMCLLKSSSQPKSALEFTITDDGLR